MWPSQTLDLGLYLHRLHLAGKRLGRQQLLWAIEPCEHGAFAGCVLTKAGGGIWADARVDATRPATQQVDVPDPISHLHRQE